MLKTMRSIQDFDLQPLELTPSKELKSVQQARWIQQLIWKLEDPVHGSTIGLFRCLFSLILIVYLISLGELVFHLEESHVALYYPRMFRVQPILPELTGLLVALSLISAVMLLVGFLTRVASLLCLGCLGYLFLICQSNYSHHGVFCCHVLLLGSCVDWACWLSVDNVLFGTTRRRCPTIPRWHLYSLQFTALVPILFTCMYKLTPDWLLRAQPAQFDSPIFNSPFLALLTAWIMTGCEILIILVFLTRPPGYSYTLPAAAMYHVLHALLEDGGFMALSTLCSLCLFMEPYQPATYFKQLKQIQWVGQLVARLKVGRPKDRVGSPVSTPRQGPTISIRPQQLLLLCFLGLLTCAQLLVPLRGCLWYKCRAAWTGQGYYASWVLPPSKEGWLYVVVQDKQGRVLELIPTADPFLASHQRTAVLEQPPALQVYLQRLTQLFKLAGRPLSTIRIHSCISLNGRDDKELYDSSFDVLGDGTRGVQTDSTHSTHGVHATDSIHSVHSTGRTHGWAGEGGNAGKGIVEEKGVREGKNQVGRGRRLSEVVQWGRRWLMDGGGRVGSVSGLAAAGAGGTGAGRTGTGAGLNGTNHGMGLGAAGAGRKRVELRMHPWSLAPGCEDKLTLERRPGMARRSREAYQDLFRAAGLLAQVRTDDEDLQRQTIRHLGKAPTGGTSQLEWAYMWELGY